MNRKIYIAGKISGDPDYRAKFEKTAQGFSEYGDIVLNPAVLPEGMTPADYMRVCFAMMESADAVVFMRDFRSSKGAMLEWTWCQYTGKQVIYELAE